MEDVTRTTVRRAGRAVAEKLRKLAKTPHAERAFVIVDIEDELIGMMDQEKSHRYFQFYGGGPEELEVWAEVPLTGRIDIRKVLGALQGVLPEVERLPTGQIVMRGRFVNTSKEPTVDQVCGGLASFVMEQGFLLPMHARVKVTFSTTTAPSH